MAIRNAIPVSFIPSGLTDAIDQESAFPGACQSLQNLTFDRQNRGAVIPRPGVTVGSSFPGFNTPGIISAMIDVGPRIYGLIGSSRNPGFDEPFCFDTAANAFITVGGILSSNIPTTPASSGTWTPPTMDVIGSKIAVTHPGFSGTNFFGWFDIGGFSASPTVTTTSTSPVLTAVSSTTGIVNGMTITGAGIPVNSFVISTTASTITINNNANASATVTATVTGGTFTLPQWGAGNTTVNALPALPIWVKQFFGRAYFGIANNVVFTDSLSLNTISNANFAAALTLGDTTNTVGAAGLPFNNSSSGILQSLIVFKSNAIYQISGDITGTGSTALSLNSIGDDTGCSMPRTIQPTMYGVLFIGSDGPRLVDLSGRLQYLKSGESSIPDIVQPFSSATSPTRACSAYNNGIYRVALDTVYRNLTVAGVATSAADFWYDFLFNRWNGIHTFPYHCAVPVGNVFYLASNTYPGVLFRSEAVPSANTVYADNAATYNISILSSTMPEAGQMMEKAIVESTIELSASVVPVTYSIIAYNDQYGQLGNVSLVIPQGFSTWGGAIWGSFNWGSSFLSTHPYTIPWPQPIVFKKMIYSISTQAAPNISIRKTAMRYQELGYTNV